MAEERNRRNAWLDGRLAALTVDERSTLREASDLLERLAAE